MTAPTNRPWVKVWRPRLGSHFEQTVSGEAKCVFRSLLVLVDDGGQTALGGADAYEGIARLLEWGPGPARRRLRRLVDELVSAGCLTLSEEGATITNWWRFQDHDHPSKDGPSSPKGRSKDHQRSVNGDAKVDQRSIKGPPKVSQSPELSTRNHAPENDKKEKEKEKKKERGSYAPARDPAPSVRGLLIRGYRDRYEQATGDAWMSHDRWGREIDTVERWLVAQAERSGEPVDALTTRWLDAVFANDGWRAHRWPWGWISEDPAKVLTGAPRSRTGHRKRTREEVTALEEYRRTLDEETGYVRPDWKRSEHAGERGVEPRRAPQAKPSRGLSAVAEIDAAAEIFGGGVFRG